MLKAAGHCIRLVGMQANGNRSCVVGWNDECKRLKEQSLFWHKLWVDSGRSKIGVVADTMRLTRRRYHLAVRHLMREQNNKRNTKLADLYVGNRCKDFWREVKRANSNYTAPRSVIDDHTTPVSIPNAFKDQYAAILRSNFVNLDQVNSFYHLLNNNCVNKDYQIFHINEVFTAYHQLKKEKKRC